MTTKSLTNVQVKDADAGTVEAVFSTFGVRDLDGDVVVKGAMQDGARVIISGYGHTSWEGRLPIGMGTIRTTDTEAILDGKFFLDTTDGRDAWATIKQVSEAGLQEWSYSLSNVVSKKGELDGKPVRFIQSVDIAEVSPVLKGASIGTRTLTVKSADLTFTEHAETVLADVDTLITRASEVVALRAEKGKTISGLSLEQLKRLNNELVLLEEKIDGELLALKTLIEEPTPILDEDLQRAVDDAYLRFVTFQGATP